MRIKTPDKLSGELVAEIGHFTLIRTKDGTRSQAWVFISGAVGLKLDFSTTTPRIEIFHKKGYKPDVYTSAQVDSLFRLRHEGTPLPELTTTKITEPTLDQIVAQEAKRLMEV